MFSKSVSLGRWLGIEIRLDFSWFIIFLLVAWSLATGVFPDTYPELGLKTNLVLGLISSVLFFLSVIIHELAHSLVAQSFGVKVKRITLFLFGGAAQLTNETPNPGAEFKTAIIGPLTSLLLSLLFWSLKIWSRGLGLGQEPIAVFSTLASVNLVLALFNLLPGYPLDGGRMLRAGLWQVSSNLGWATRWAAVSGRVVAWLLVLFGASRLLAGDFSGGIWLIFLGLFLDQAASGHERESLLRTALADITVKEVMWPDPPTVPAQTSIQDLINHHLLPSRHRCLPVTDEKGQLLGLVCVGHLKKELRRSGSGQTVAELMIPLDRIRPLNPDQDVVTAAHYLAAAEISALPVVENNKLVGLFSEEDLGLYLALASVQPKDGI